MVYTIVYGIHKGSFKIKCFIDHTFICLLSFGTLIWWFFLFTIFTKIDCICFGCFQGEGSQRRFSNVFAFIKVIFGNLMQYALINYQITTDKAIVHLVNFCSYTKAEFMRLRIKYMKCLNTCRNNLFNRESVQLCLFDKEMVHDLQDDWIG